MTDDLKTPVPNEVTDDVEDIDNVEHELRALLGPLAAPTLGERADERVPDGFGAKVIAAAQAQKLVSAAPPVDAETSHAATAESAPGTSPPVTSLLTWRRRAMHSAPTAAFGALAAGIAMLLYTALPAMTSSNGQATLTANEEVHLAGRAIAVGQSDAKLTWNVDSAGAAVVEQSSGRVFYRVNRSERGAPFVVRTPGGDVRVLGTCFSVEIDPMTTTQQLSMWNKGKLAAAGAVAGAVLTGAVMVTVFEGKVDLDSSEGTRLELSAGDAALSSAGRAPMKIAPKIAALEQEKAALQTQGKALRGQVDELEQQLKVVMMAQANGEDPRAAENAALRQELEDVRGRLSAFERDADSRAGTPMAWPENIDPIFKEDHIKDALLTSLRDLGLNGDIESVDCAEFPCMIFGQIEIDGYNVVSAQEMKKFSEAVRSKFPKEGVSQTESVWGKSIPDNKGGTKHKNHFGVSFYPDDAVTDDTKKDFQKRSRYRMQAFSESLVE